MYGNFAYVLSSWIEIPYIAVETIIGVNTMYWLIGFDGDISVWIYYNVIYFLYLTAQTYMGMVISALMPNVVSSQIIAALFINICSLFAGTVCPEANIPDYYKFLYWASPQKWAQEGVIVTQFHGDDTNVCNPSGKPCVDCPAAYGSVCTDTGFANGQLTGKLSSAADYVLDDFLNGYKYDMRNYDIMTLLIWVLVSRLLLATIINKVNHLKR
jgi:ABC-type multidrug transport system permease subunit